MEGYFDISDMEFGEYFVESGKVLFRTEGDASDCEPVEIEGLVLVNEDGIIDPHENISFYRDAEEFILQKMHDDDYSDWFQTHVMDE